MAVVSMLIRRLAYGTCNRIAITPRSAFQGKKVGFHRRINFTGTHSNVGGRSLSSRATVPPSGNGRFKVIAGLIALAIGIGGAKLYADSRKPTHLIGVRHGETHRNKAGERISGQENGEAAQLNETGRKQADELGKELERRYAGKVARIYTSPLDRARETAMIIQSHFPEVQLVVEPRLMEVDHGRYDTMPYKKRNAECAARYRQMEEAAREKGETVDPLYKWRLRLSDIIEYTTGMTETPKEGDPENALEVHARVTEAIEEMRKKHPGKIVLFVSHAGVIKLLTIEAESRANGYSGPLPMYFEPTPQFSVLPGNCSATHFKAAPNKPLAFVKSEDLQNKMQ